MDAISFVLGIKSAQLRSSQLRDLIYRGRAMHEDDDEDGDVTAIEGRANNPKRAWVMAVYQDDNGNEIKFARTITTSGPSEYKINNKVVTYQKYNEALEKQNILVKARNFLVFQGDVEAVASQSPKDLTRLIEQISGSAELKVEYEQLKVQQERATENSAFNFNKKRGINAEIKQYQEQRAEAERFEQLQNDKTQLTIKYLLWRLYHIDKQIKESRKEMSSLGEKITAKQKEQERVDRQLRDARAEQAKVHRTHYQLERDILTKERELEEKRPELLTLEEKIIHSNKKIKHYEANAEKIDQDYQKQTRHVDKLKQDLEEITSAAQRYEAVRAEGSAHPTWQNITKGKNDILVIRKEEVNRQMLKEKQQLENLRRQQKTSSEATQRLKEKISELSRRRQQVMEEKDASLNAKEKVAGYVAQLTTDLENQRNDLHNVVNERNRITKRESELNTQLQVILNRLNDARVDQRESEREARMKESLNSLKRVFSGVYGRFIDLCQPTQRKYEVATSIILGRNMDAIIVATEKTAIECIQYMREQRLGHATFIPLDTIAVRPINDKYRSLMKGARLAIDVIEYPDELERALQYACGNTLVCDDLEIAKAICYGRNQEVKAVTLDGTIIHKSGLITGGRSGIEAGAQRFKEQEVDALRRKRDAFLAQLNELIKLRRKGHSEEQMKGEISAAEQKLSLFRDDLDNIIRKLASLESELRIIEDEILQVTPKHEQSQTTLSQLENQIQTIEKAIHSKEDTIFADFCKKINVGNIREYEQRQLKMAQEAAEMRLRFTTHQSRYQNLLTFETEQLKETADRLQKIREFMSNDKKLLANFERRRNAMLADNERVNNEIAELRHDLDRTKEEYETKSEIVNNLRKELAQKTREVDKMLKDISNREADVKKCSTDQFFIFRKCKLEDIDIPLLSGSLENIPLEDSSLQDGDPMDLDDGGSRANTRSAARAARGETNWNVEVDYSGLDREQKEDDSPETEQKFLKDIQEKAAEIERVAPNLKAIERLDGVEQRLHETEREFDSARREAKTAKEKFNAIKQKRHIAERIDQIYKDLTKSRNFPLGGTAYLSLEDTEEPYLDGVKYHAMPPMKRFRDMEQLSGGEKTMAALALLFAIHSYQPSPFFVLDEVDAALDNTNVAKIANYIREHASDTFQFIVISLKSTLYEKAQALVGIYRDQDVNSSRTLTLQLDQYEE
ncbi:9826_t:CDS:10 [Paraglomus occultum]|uniref:Structural maintenance of chromosomes protein n=1 Tax=Paraglomus occultum TaxID=144539 RepID=A0A9N9G7X8_9GLOM|nr:9826_t:CDS:10 [Paraglomus occultum]